MKITDCRQNNHPEVAQSGNPKTYQPTDAQLNINHVAAVIAPAAGGKHTDKKHQNNGGNGQN